MRSDEEFPKKLRALRLSRDLTQDQLAALIRADTATIRNYETGRREPDFARIDALAEALNVTPAFFFPGFDDELPAAPEPTPQEALAVLAKLVENQNSAPAPQPSEPPQSVASELTTIFRGIDVTKMDPLEREVFLKAIASIADAYRHSLDAQNSAESNQGQKKRRDIKA